MKIRVQNISFSYTSVPVLKDVSFDLSPSEVICLVGPNGSGKSTLVRCIDNILKPQSGDIFLDNRNVKNMHRREVARYLGYVSQGAQQSFPVTVFDTVLMGRRPHASWRCSGKDVDKVVEVLQLLGLEPLALRDFSLLSGGQQQRVTIARALAQEPEVLLLDEATSALDICHQLEVMETLMELVRQHNISAIMAVHDLNMASRYADRVVMLNEGTVFADGEPADVFTMNNIARVYGVKASVHTDEDGKTSIVPICRIRPSEDTPVW